MNTAALQPAFPAHAYVAMAREANRALVYFLRVELTHAAVDAVKRRAKYMALARASAITFNTLARRNGWGSAGECPATACAKTPAAGEQVCPATDDSACETQQLAAGGGIRA